METEFFNLEGEEGRKTAQDTRGDVPIITPSSSEYLTIKGKRSILIWDDATGLNWVTKLFFF